MKTTTTTLIIALLLVSCNKDKVLESVEKHNSIENALNAYDHDVLVRHSSNSYFGGMGSVSNLQLIAKEHGIDSKDVDLGNFYFDNSLIEIGGKKSSTSSQLKILDFNKYVGKSVNFKYDGNLALGFQPFESKISIVKALQSTMLPSVDNKIDLKKDFTIYWKSEDNNDDLFIDVAWWGDRNEYIPKHWFKTIKDNGSFAIPSTVFKDYPLHGKVDIHLIRCSYESEKIGEKNVFILSTSTMNGLFEIANLSNN